MSLLKNGLLILLVMVANTFVSQEISWTNISNLDDSLKANKKPVIVKIETPWCTYCKMMDAKIFGHKKFIKKLKDDYYFVKLNAEGKDPIEFNGKTYDYLMYSARSGVHKLAKKLGEENGKMNYPTTVVLNSDYSIKKRIQGYLPRQQFMYWLEE